MINIIIVNEYLVNKEVVGYCSTEGFGGGNGEEDLLAKVYQPSEWNATTCFEIKTVNDGQENYLIDNKDVIGYRFIEVEGFGGENRGEDSPTKFYKPS